MKFHEIQQHVKGLPYITEDNARLLYDFVLANDITRILELGIGHGASSCYIAAALDEKKTDCRLVCVDLKSARESFQPSLEELLAQTGLEELVSIYRMESGYTWFLRNEIARCTTNYICTPSYDLCIVDGAKNWTIDGAAFFMADKLLKSGGWMLFDDYTWTHARAKEKGKQGSDGISHRRLSNEEISLPQIREVYQLLVMQSPQYGNFKIHGEGDWAWAQKTGENSRLEVTVEYTTTFRGLASKLYRVLRNLSRELFSSIQRL
jgi:predicted O-methyltransferase YrrM